jgi:type IV pilus assembly protein PilB
MIGPVQHPTIVTQKLRHAVVPPRPGSPPAVQDTGHALAVCLIHAGYLTEAQWAHARKVQSKLATPTTLLHVLHDLQVITPGQFQQLLRTNQVTLGLGELLVELGDLRAADLETVCRLQQSTQPQKTLGEMLVERHCITAPRLAEVLAAQLGLVSVEPHLTAIDQELVAKAPMRSYARHLFLPLTRQDNQVVVAFANPLDRRARETAEQVFGTHLIPAVASLTALQEALASLTPDVRQSTAAVLNDSTVAGMVQAMFAAAVEEKASAIHLEPMQDRLRVRLRCDGTLVPYKEFRHEFTTRLTSHLKALAQVESAETRHHQEGRLRYADPQCGLTIDMQASFYATVYGDNIVLHLLHKPARLLDLTELGMAPTMLDRFRHDVLDTPTGIILITGPPGAGTTTTLYSCMQYLHDMHTCIVTAEEPVEYVIEGIVQGAMHPTINVTCDDTLRHLVRQDPDVIVLGQLRDRLYADIALQAALAGHKILTTCHTEDSMGGVLQLFNMDIEAFLLSSPMVCVVAQRLMRAVCQHCAEPYTPTPAELHRLGYKNTDLKEATGKLGRGCHLCRFTGYQGRIGAFELLIFDAMSKDAMLARHSAQEIRRLSFASSGLVTLLEDGIVKAARGLTSFQEVLYHLPRLRKPRPLRELRRLLGEL